MAKIAKVWIVRNHSGVLAGKKRLADVGREHNKDDKFIELDRASYTAQRKNLHLFCREAGSFALDKNGSVTLSAVRHDILPFVASALPAWNSYLFGRRPAVPTNSDTVPISEAGVQRRQQASLRSDPVRNQIRASDGRRPGFTLKPSTILYMQMSSVMINCD